MGAVFQLIRGNHGCRFFDGRYCDRDNIVPAARNEKAAYNPPPFITGDDNEPTQSTSGFAA